MKLFTLLCLAAAAVVGFRANAQTLTASGPRPTPPPGPFLNATPEFSAWTIVKQALPGMGSQPSEEVARNVAAISKPDSFISVVKTGQVRHRTRKLKSGEQEDTWYEHGSRVTMAQDWQVPMFEAAVSAASHPEGADFPELAWISAGNFTGIQKYGDVEYLVFESPAAGDAPAKASGLGSKSMPVFNRAYINAETRFPWLLQTGDVLQRYVFQPAPAAPLDVPPAYQAMFDAYEKRKIESARRPVAP